MYVIGIVHPSLQADWDNQLADIVNNSFRRSCWSLALCWMIFACVHGYGGPVNWFLSLRVWKFLARISYAIYLFHSLVQLTTASAAVAPVYFSVKTLFASFVTDLVYTVAWAMIACIAVEEPVFTLQRIFLHDAFKSQPRLKENKIKPASGAEGDEIKDIEKLNRML
ncbi:hypothetical protein MSG28_014514 [Choristoneura fumiferana]|uniref:Uncharacterized protein n=1 Tax=Choristoneura fumiferana TaxID=7141 RepID=A0ACC0JRV2_CHOFU|nr:hypothetical protein MSG28_014514 [Choristoneura fumiferana]